MNLWIVFFGGLLFGLLPGIPDIYEAARQALRDRRARREHARLSRPAESDD